MQPSSTSPPAGRRNSLPNTLVDPSDNGHGNGTGGGDSSSSQRTRPVGSPLFLGLAFSLDRLEATLLDADLAIVECVEVVLDALGSDPPTEGGVWRASEGSVRQPVEVVFAAVDALLDRLGLKWDLGRIVGIAGCAHNALVLLGESFADDLAAISPSSSLRAHFGRSPNAFTLSALTTSLDTTTHGQRSVLAKAASIKGTSTLTDTPLLLRSGAVQLLRLPWKKAARLASLSAVLESVFVGELVEWEDGSAAETMAGLWDARAREWSQDAADVVAGGPGAGEGLLQRLVGYRSGSGGSGVRTVGEDSARISEYLRERHGFSAECTVAPFIPESLAAHASLCPLPDDAVLSLSQLDILTFPLPADPPPSSIYQTLPHPVQPPGEVKRFVGQISTCNGGAARTQIKASYANSSWSILSQMVPVVPPGGSLGFDDKLFLFQSWPNKEVHPFGVVDGVVRFESGVATAEFGDLRANPRCLIESQFLAFRTRYSAVVSAIRDGRPTTGTPPRTALGLGFEPFDVGTLPKRVLVTESPMETSPSIMSTLGEIFGAPVYKGNRHHFRGGDAVPESSPTAGSIGAAYIARWHVAAAASTPERYDDFILSLLNAQPAAHSYPPRPLLRPRPSRSSLSSGQPSPLTLSAIEESGDERPTTRTLHRSKSAHLLSAKAIGSSGGCGLRKERGSAEHSDQTLTLLATPDRDAARAYCSMVPEFLRLEELFVKDLVSSF